MDFLGSCCYVQCMAQIDGMQPTTAHCKSHQSIPACRLIKYLRQHKDELLNSKAGIPMYVLGPILVAHIRAPICFR